jgi:hypothetical protein
MTSNSPMAQIVLCLPPNRVDVGSMLGRMDEKSSLKPRLAILLREAEQAHGEYEKSLGHRDDDWPDWYAAYIAERL